MVPWSSTSTQFLAPLLLLVAAALMGWLFFGSLSPTVDNTGTTTPVAQPDLPSPATPGTKNSAPNDAVK
jgi:hypothetical protein